MPLGRFTIRVPEILLARVQSYIQKRSEQGAYSFNEFFLEAARNQLDGRDAAPLAGSRGGERRPSETPTVGKLRSAAEIAASIPGVKLGVGLAEAQDVARRGSIATEPVEEDIPTRPWYPELAKVQRLAEENLGEANELFLELLRQSVVEPAPNVIRAYAPCGSRKELAKLADRLDAECPLPAAVTE
jgi:hypothetical protein